MSLRPNTQPIPFLLNRDRADRRLEGADSLKAIKDRRQAAFLVEALAADRPDDLRDPWRMRFREAGGGASACPLPSTGIPRRGSISAPTSETGASGAPVLHQEASNAAQRK